MDEGAKDVGIKEIDIQIQKDRELTREEIDEICTHLLKLGSQTGIHHLTKLGFRIAKFRRVRHYRVTAKDRNVDADVMVADVWDGWLRREYTMIHIVYGVGDHEEAYIDHVATEEEIREFLERKIKERLGLEKRKEEGVIYDDGALRIKLVRTADEEELKKEYEETIGRIIENTENELARKFFRGAGEIYEGAQERREYIVEYRGKEVGKVEVWRYKPTRIVFDGLIRKVGYQHLPDGYDVEADIADTELAREIGGRIYILKKKGLLDEDEGEGNEE